MGWIDTTADRGGYLELDESDGVAIQEGEAVYCSRRCRGLIRYRSAGRQELHLVWYHRRVEEQSSPHPHSGGSFSPESEGLLSTQTSPHLNRSQLLFERNRSTLLHFQKTFHVLS